MMAIVLSYARADDAAPESDDDDGDVERIVISSGGPQEGA